MKRAEALITTALLLLTAIKPNFAQISLPNEIHAIKIEQPLKIDGDLSEPQWQKANRISNFTQRELNEGKPATERTEVAVLYDRENLYFGVWCFDSDPEKLIAQRMKRDFDYSTEDNFKIVIDTYNDKRNGYLFVTNPNAARFDALIQDNGQQVNRAWDGVWTVKTKITDRGWFAEFKIPFSSLKFSSENEPVWGVNFERNIRRKREQDLWQGWSRDSRLEQVTRAGKLYGIKGIGGITLIEFKPYGTAGIEKKSGESQSIVRHAGGDLNYLITPTMKLNLTVNTDFAQVESDRMQVNLTRFSLFYPEKREFFLEGRNYFDFGLGHSIRPFYSRRIGLSPDNSVIPILGGVRLLGKTGNSMLGGMSIQTEKKDSIPTTNYTALRWKQDIWQQSSIGLIGVGKFEPNRQNAVYGLDFLYSTSEFLGSKTLALGGAVAQSYTSDREQKTGLAHRLFIDMPNDFIDFSAIWDRSNAQFNPETGFLRRKNYQMFMADFRIKPRPTFLPFVQRLVFKPFDFNYYIDDRTHKLQSLWSEFRPLGFTLKSGDFFESNVQRRAENLTKDFEIHDDIIIPAGEYWFTRYELQFETFDGRPVYGFLFINWGDFYTGKRTEWFIRNTIKVNKHINISYDFTQNIINLPQGNFTVNEVGSRMEFAVSPDLFGSVFGQWNSDENEVLLNFRVNWIPKLGSDFFFVVNQAFDTSGHSWRLINTTVLSKFVWRFVL
ncbi:MAG: carbohydrate binding family 9 domain-containing protein [Calditrichaeota bacterium]|nr:carbohydrate binding family 9 domain-containing protein [Calditrichota bacterium]